MNGQNTIALRRHCRDMTSVVLNELKLLKTGGTSQIIHICYYSLQIVNSNVERQYNFGNKWIEGLLNKCTAAGG